MHVGVDHGGHQGPARAVDHRGALGCLDALADLLDLVSFDQDGLGIALVCAAACATGYALLGGVPPTWLSFVQTFAAGAILMVLANTMMPEPYAHGGKLAGVFTVLGFATSVYVILLERALAG